MNVLLTKPENSIQSLAEAVAKMGYTPQLFPTIVIQKNPDFFLDISSLSTAHAAIFCSHQAVQIACPLLRTHLKKLQHLHWIAIGAKTATALQQENISDILIPKRPFSSESLLSLPILQSIQDKTIWLFKGKAGRPLMRTVLQQRGAVVTTAEVYQRDLPKTQVIESSNQWPHNPLDIIVTTSADCLRNLLQLLEKRVHTLRNIPVIVVGPRMFDLALELGFKNPILATDADNLTIINVLRAFKEQKT